MIQKIKIKNFKCYKDCTIKLKNFNVLCGPNSSGKSSIIQALLFLLQNQHGSVDHLITNGDYVHFDEFSEIKNDEISTTKPVSIEIIGDDKKVSHLEIEKAKDSDEIKCVNNLMDYKLLAEETIYYLSADRIGPEDVYDKYNGTKIGFHGENAVGFIAKNKERVISSEFILQNTPTHDFTFLTEVNFWLQEIIGEKINASDLERTDRTRATYSKEGKSLQVRNKNTGSGLSYVISIIAMVFSLSINKPHIQPTFIIENPEIHLHPKAQMKLMEFLFFMSKFCQFIIETHSDHIIKNVLDNNGQVIKLHNFEPVYYTKKSRKILPTMTVGEIKWVAFDMPTIDFHVSLYSYLQARFNAARPNKLDDEIRNTASFKSNPKLYDTKCRRFLNDSSSSVSEYETLPTYLRNAIDHPKRIKSGEPARKKFRRNEMEFENALRTSIDLMINIINEKKW